MSAQQATDTTTLSAHPGEADPHPASIDIDDKQFRLLADNIPTLCWMAEADGYVIWYNRRWHEYCGSTPEQMAGWGWQSVHDPDILPLVLDRWKESVATGHPFEMTFPMRRADGIFKPFLTRVHPIRNAEGVVVNWFGTNVDVSAQVEAENDLRISSLNRQRIAAEHEATLAQLGEGVIVTDPNGRITFVNEAATRLHGVARLDVEPEDYTSAYSLWTEDGLPYPIDKLPLTRAVRNHETVVDARWVIRRPDGSEVLALGNAKPIYAEDKSLIGAVLTIRDDTLRHRAEEAMQQVVRIKDVLLQEVNHRVKNNLQLVISLLSLQAQRTARAEVRESLTEACARIGVIAGMHERLYVSSGQETVDLTAHLNALSRETIAALEGAKGIKVECLGNAKLPVLLDDAVSIALIVNELITNAVKYAFEETIHPIISVEIARVNAEIFITLRDNGKGLPADFDPASSEGLGMLIVTALVSQVGGTLSLVPQPQGACFVVTVPESRLLSNINAVG